MEDILGLLHRDESSQADGQEEQKHHHKKVVKKCRSKNVHVVHFFHKRFFLVYESKGEDVRLLKGLRFW